MKTEEIRFLLPGIFQRTLDSRPSILQALLSVMEQMHTPAEAALEHIDTYFDPRCAPDAFIPYLAYWVDMDRFLDKNGRYPAGWPQLRILIASAAELARQRGTRPGLIQFLQKATGIQGFKITDDPERPFHVKILLPYPKPHKPRRFQSREDYLALVDAIVQAEKPAYLTYEIDDEPQATPAPQPERDEAGVSQS